MLDNKKVSAVIPCFNEAQALPVILESMPGCITEVIVVDNRSTDNSAEIAGKYPVKVITEEARGYGAALMKGIRYATGDIIVLLDADATYPLGDLKEVLAFMENNRLDFISGYRFPSADINKTMPLINRAGNHFISWLINILFGLQIKDSQSGLMIFKKQILDKIKLKNRGMGFSQEIKIKAWLLERARCAEVKISYKPRIGRSKFRKIPDSLKNFFALLNLYVKIRNNREYLDACIGY